MVERDCSKHQLKVYVSLDRSKLLYAQHSNLIAALLRQLADYTDGWCSTEYATDDGLLPTNYMTFYFKDDEKRGVFINRVKVYLADDINAALSVRRG